MDAFAASVHDLIADLEGWPAGVGLFLVAFFDSSLLSLPEINDLLVIYLSTSFKEHAYLFAFMAVTGSMTGCSLLYWVARSKGYHFLQKRYSEGRVQSAMRVFQRFGVLAVIVPALLPPPFPFKIFVLSAGVFGLTFSRFIVAVLVGRGIRYFSEAFLAVRYGELAFAFIEANYRYVIFMVAGLVLLGFALYMLRRLLWATVEE